MCHHCFVTHGDVRVCYKCGLTILPNGKTFYDTKLKKIVIINPHNNYRIMAIINCRNLNFFEFFNFKI